MSDKPLGEIFFDVRLHFDPNTEKLTVNNIKRHTKKIGKELENIVADSTAEGMVKGAKEGARKIGRHGFGGGGFGLLTPFNPKVMAAYFSARYMHMAMNSLFKMLDETIKQYFMKYQYAKKEEITDPTQKSFELLKGVREITPTMSTKTALFLEEITKGTGLKSTDIASELKKMMDAKRAGTPEEALKKYIDLLNYNDAGRTLMLQPFGGSESIASQFKYSNVKKSLLDFLSGKEFERYADSFEKLLEQSEAIEKQKLLDRANIIKSPSLKYGTASIYKEVDVAEKKRGKNIYLAESLWLKNILDDLEKDKKFRDYATKNPLGKMGGKKIGWLADYYESIKDQPKVIATLEAVNNTLLKILDIMYDTDSATKFDTTKIG